jgi:hypothetical protein
MNEATSYTPLPEGGWQKFSHQAALPTVHWQVAPLHQPLSPATSSVVPGASHLGRRTYLNARYNKSRGDHGRGDPSRHPLPPSIRLR